VQSQDISTLRPSKLCCLWSTEVVLHNI